MSNNDTSAIRVSLADVRMGWFNSDDEFLAKYDRVIDETVIPFLAEAGFAPDNEGNNVAEWTDKVQTILTYLCITDERFEKTLFAALHDHIRAVAVQDDEYGVALVCDHCGEAFDDLLIAQEHESKCESWADGHNYLIKPRSEAF